MYKRGEKLYLTDIIESAYAILEYTKDLSFEEFSNDRKVYSATIREFEIIGEAVGKISDDTKDKYKNIQWQDIKDFRNLLIHQYFGIDFEIIWNVVKDDLPELLKVVERILQEQEK